MYDASDSDGPKVGCTGGILQFIGLESFPSIGPLDPIDVADGDVVFIQCEADNVWQIQTDTDYPTDMLFVSLVNNIPVSAGVGGSPDFVDWAEDGSDFDWSGGDIVMPEMYRVTVTGDDGYVGTPPGYREATTEGGIDLFTTYTVSNNSVSGHDDLLAYKAGTLGLALLNSSGGFDLLVFDELPKTKTQKTITSITWDGTTLSDTYQYLVVFDTDTNDTSLDVFTGSPCPG